MARKYSPSLIGGFVLGGIVLFIAALFLFGSGDLLEEKRRWVTYFEGSVGGLNVGAPVNFRGVRVGTVTDVVLILDRQNLTARIPVYFEIDPDSITWVGGQAPQSRELAAKAGLRAKLGLQSLVTGQMQVELDLLPDTPAQLVGADPETPEIPSLPSEFDVLKKEMAELPLPELIATMQRTIGNLDRLITSPEMRNSLTGLAASLNETQKLVATLNQQAGPLMRELTATAQSARTTSDQAAASLRSLDGELQTTLSEVRQLTASSRGDVKTALRSLNEVLVQAQATLGGINGIVADDAQARRDIDRALHNIAQATSSLRSFADTVERNPNAIIVGR